MHFKSLRGAVIIYLTLYEVGDPLRRWTVYVLSLCKQCLVKGHSRANVKTSQTWRKNRGIRDVRLEDDPMRLLTEACLRRDAEGKLSLSMREILRNIQFIGACDLPSPIMGGG